MSYARAVADSTVSLEDPSTAAPFIESGGKGSASDFPESLPHYFCVIDFESTCEENSQIQNQEIIEFPAVLVNASTLEVEAEFRSHVRPTHNPVLSRFCTNLTGIQQTEVDEAPVFPTVLQRFVTFMNDLGFDLERNWGYELGKKVCDPFRVQNYWDPAVENKRTVEYVTCGDWDLKTMLPNQCSLSHLKVPLTMRRWTNVKQLFGENFPKIRHKGMPNMLSALKLPLIGRHHSGIDDARNITRILIADRKSVV